MRSTTLLFLFAAVKGVSGNCSSNEEALLGVDYYPEQWPEAEMRADMKSIKEDLGADVIRIGEFMWHFLEPSDGVFNFTLMDAILDTADEFGLTVMLGTPTATMPAWLHKAHGSEVLALGPDSPEGYQAATPGFGGRRQYSFNSAVYLEYARRIVTEIAKRYGSRKSIKFWQVDNELGHEGSDMDFSDNALKAWRSWLKEAYRSSIDKLNEEWGTAFWSVTFNDFSEVPLPKYTVPGTPARPNENFRSNSNPGMLLDYRRFRRDSVTAFADMQVDILREHVNGCVTTNAPGGTWDKTLDYNDVFAKMDFVSYDNYPVWGGSVEPTQPSRVAMDLAVVRGWGPVHNQGFTIAEQLIGAQGHDIIGYTPRPGQVVAWSAQALLHGATAISFFRWRAAVFGQEQFCYGILDHSTPRGQGRKWKEAKQLYALARQHQDVWLEPIQASVALVYDIDNIFMWQGQPQSTSFSFGNEAHRMYRPFWRQGAAVDVLSSPKLLKRCGTAKSLQEQYPVLLLPAPMHISEQLFALLEDYVQLGGALWLGFRSDLKDASGRVRRQSSRLAALAGVRIEEIESLNDPAETSVTSSEGESTAKVWREGLVLENATALFKHSDSFFGSLGYAAATHRSLGQGEVLYLGAGIAADALVKTAGRTLKAQDVPHVGLAAETVEQLLRRDRQGQLWHVAINHGSAEAPSSMGSLAAFEVRLQAATPQLNGSFYKI